LQDSDVSARPTFHTVPVSSRVVDGLIAIRPSLRYSLCAALAARNYVLARSSQPYQSSNLYASLSVSYTGKVVVRLSTYTHSVGNVIYGRLIASLSYDAVRYSISSRGYR